MYLPQTTTQVPEESSPAPMPIDVMLNANYIARKAHESIKGIKVMGVCCIMCENREGLQCATYKTSHLATPTRFFFFLLFTDHRHARGSDHCSQDLHRPGGPHPWGGVQERWATFHR